MSERAARGVQKESEACSRAARGRRCCADEWRLANSSASAADKRLKSGKARSSARWRLRTAGPAACRRDATPSVRLGCGAAPSQLVVKRSCRIRMHKGQILSDCVGGDGRPLVGEDRQLEKVAREVHTHDLD